MLRRLRAICGSFEVTGYRLQVTGYRFQVSGYRLQVTGCRCPFPLDGSRRRFCKRKRWFSFSAGLGCLTVMYLILLRLRVGVVHLVNGSGDS